MERRMRRQTGLVLIGVEALDQRDLVGALATQVVPRQIIVVAHGICAALAV